ncbi:uncharacterized protein YjiK [Winogradskyella epiphytica]|uniref:Uncharacterized protein YjiK n=1 Tax=Winogradskyella epiphytica TaxID=262005 RepID=A0A2V4XVE8_9FLAO|nr:SdiA-regulated domain-containing protein [Winogradskyella epiphytica]PYE82757.1 uncharacterized protein YjiK [Winogradskyella epiphytica]GGW53378.1 hypothetical protein GCM10008085_00600 [Winogradskyella epiphytica]
MKITKSNVTVIITLIFSAILLALQGPVTKALVKKSDRLNAKYAVHYTIKSTFTLPDILREISGIVWLDENTFASIQDEDGFIYVYDVAENEIKDKIEFANSGDYEGIAINENDAYVMRSDGLLFVVKNYRSEHPEISEIQTPFSSDNDIESLNYDPDNNRLLTAPKEEDLITKNIKGIYQIPLKTMRMDSMPIIKINLKSEKLKPFRHKKIHKTFNPSGMAIHPITKEIYLVDGKKPKLMVLNMKGEILKALPLDKRKFAQPEGITFSDDGRLFISNEAGNKHDNGNILEVELKE